MTVRQEATRASAIAAAADKFAGEDLPFWSDSEYLEGICSILADTFGVDDPHSGRSEIWGEISAAHGRAQLLDAANDYAQTVARDCQKVLTRDEFCRAIAAAWLDGRTSNP